MQLLKDDTAIDSAVPLTGRKCAMVLVTKQASNLHFVCKYFILVFLQSPSKERPTNLQLMFSRMQVKMMSK
eukprot:scaffold10323_cov40-Cyclotella_meneghiniana.AAC.1